MKHPGSRNYPLWIGIALTGFFLIIAIVGPRLAPDDPMKVYREFLVVGDRSIAPARQPIPPLTSPMFLLGTDNVGRDLLSRLLWAIRPTLLLCFIIASLRLLIGVLLGLIAGWFEGAPGRFVDVLIDISLAVPILLFALAVISFLGDTELPTYIIALVATGWASTAVFVRNSTQVIRRAPFIDGARAIGVPPFGILRRHVFPQLWPALPALISFELAATLLVIAELGFLGLFIGDAFIIMVEDPNSGGSIPVGMTAGFPELAQMISDFWNKMLRTPWEVAIIGSVIFLIIFAFNMLGEGLRQYMDVTRPRRWLTGHRSQPDQFDLELNTPNLTSGNTTETPISPT